MINPKIDPFVIEHQGSRSWTVWCKSPSAPKVALNAITCQSLKDPQGHWYTKLTAVPIVCNAFNFTTLAMQHGFQPISGRAAFFAGGDYMGAEWWHFGYTQDMVNGRTTFGDELLKVYTLAEVKKLSYWDQVKGATWGVDWTG
jgi:hypothetical protein